MSPIVTILMTVLDADHAQAVVDHRRITIKKPLTEFAAKLLAKKFALCANPNGAAATMIERCWQGFEPAWLKETSLPARNQRNADGAHDQMADMLFGTNATGREDVRYGDLDLEANHYSRRH